jgi:hypothetical protein
MWRRRALLGALTIVLLTLAVLPTDSSFTGSTSNPTSNFSAATSFCSSFTPVWLTGMEHGAASTAGGGIYAGTSMGAGSSVSADSAVTRSGAYSMKLVKASGAAGYVDAVSLTGAGAIVIRFALRFNALPTADGEVVRLLSAVGSGAILRLNTAGRLTVDFNGAGSSGTSAPLSVGRWYRIDLRITFNTNPRTMDWRIDGVAQTQGSSSETASTANGNLQLGAPSTATVYTIYLDDITVTTTSGNYPLPDGHIEALLPDAVSAVNDPAGSKLQDNTSANVTVATPGAASRLDELPMTVITDYVKHIGTNNASYVETSFANVASTGCVDAVNAVVAYHASTATGGVGAAYIYDGATQRTLQASGSITNTAIAYKSARISPASGTWDTTKLNGLVARVGYSSNATATNYPTWDALLLEYEQVPDVATNYSNTVLADSPAGYWRLGELSGTTATAASGTPNGTYTNGPLLGMGGAVHDTDTAVKFDGSNDYVTFGDVYDFTGTSSFSLEAWVKPAAAATANFPMIISKYGTSGWNLYMENNAQPNADAVTLERLASGSDYASTATSLQPGTWYHVVATYDGSRMRIYLNGVLGDDNASSRSLTDTATAMNIGGTGDEFNGQIDEVAIYTTVLNQTRIQAHYDAGKP